MNFLVDKHYEICNTCKPLVNLPKGIAVLGERLKRLRNARGLSQDDLVALIGGLVSKQSISKYERGLSKPSPRILSKLAKTFGVKSSYFWKEPSIKVDFIAYRKGSKLGSTEEAKVEANVSELLEEWINLKELTDPLSETDIPIQDMPVRTLEDAEQAAVQIRIKWNLGLDPIASVTGMLENHNVFVVEIDEKKDFDGVSAYAKDSENNVVAAAVVSRKDIPGERQRLNMVHELGHLVLRVPTCLDEEKAAFRFGAALLAPKELIHKEIGIKRSNVNISELLLLKKQLGISLQALVYRLKDLDVIPDSVYRSFFVLINKRKWKQSEPGELKPEKSFWLKKSVLRALSEGLITNNKAEQLLGKKIKSTPSKYQAFMSLSGSERGTILAEQAKKAASNYEIDDDWIDMETGYGISE